MVRKEGEKTAECTEIFFPDYSRNMIFIKIPLANILSALNYFSSGGIYSVVCKQERRN